jgi:hypothetical protein
MGERARQAVCKVRPSASLCLYGIALAVQLFYLAESRDEPTFARPIVDAAPEAAWARRAESRLKLYRSHQPLRDHGLLR